MLQPSRVELFPGVLYGENPFRRLPENVAGPKLIPMAHEYNDCRCFVRVTYGILGKVSGTSRM